MSDKKKTPMTILKGNFDNFLVHTKKMNLSYIELSFEKPKDIRGYYGNDRSKSGVESDFIRIFTVDSNRSFSFVYTFFEKDKKTISDIQYVQVCFKEAFNGKVEYLTSKMYTVEEMKAVFKEINKDLSKNENIDAVSFFKTLKTKYAIQENDSLDKEEEIKSKIMSEQAELISLIKKNTKKESKIELVIQNKNLEMNDFLANDEDALKIKKLEAELRELKENFRVKTANKTKELKISSSLNELIFIQIEKEKLSTRLFNCLNIENLKPTNRLSVKKIKSIFSNLL